jgi:Lantibiotic biosynthesis dehydratase C-term
MIQERMLMARNSDQETPPVPLSANIYCNRHLDELLSSAIQPFKRRLLQRNDATDLFWFSRYARCGEHLKIRLHVPQDDWPSYKQDLTEEIEKLFLKLPVEDASLGRISTPGLPPIDTEDADEEDYPDRTILWTCFRPSPVTFGSTRYLDDLQFLSHFYSCMAAGCNVILDSLTEGGVPTSKDRQARLMKIVVSGFFALPLSVEEQLHYLTYHRDWLLRYLLVSLSASTTSQQTLNRLDERLEGMENVVVSISAVIQGQRMSGGPAESESLRSHSDLHSALRDFHRYVSRFRGNPEYNLDPYTSDSAFLPLFKVFHGFANQAGVPIVQELYTYHLLLRSFERSLAFEEVGSGRTSG